MGLGRRSVGGRRAGPTGASDLLSLGLFLGLSLGLAALACSKPAAETANAHETNSSIRYAFGSIDGRLISSTENQGRVTVLLFGATYDLVTQAVSRRLGDLWHSHSPRTNVALLLLEPPQNVEMVRAYRDMLGLDYPVGLGDSGPEEAGGAFSPIQVIPTWIFLDRRGRAVARVSGDMSFADLVRFVERAEDAR
jgi:hypothetical protein